MVTNKCNQVRKNTLHCLFVYCQTAGLVLRQGVDFVLPLSQQQESSPKSYRRDCTKTMKLKLDFETKGKVLLHLEPKKILVLILNMIDLKILLF